MILLIAEKSPKKELRVEYAAGSIPTRFNFKRFKTNLQRILTLHKPVIRIVDQCNYDALTKSISKKLKLFKFHNIHLVQLSQSVLVFL